MVLIIVYTIIITAVAAFFAGFVLGINPKRATMRESNEQAQIIGIKDEDYKNLLNYDGLNQSE